MASSKRDLIYAVAGLASGQAAAQDIPPTHWPGIAQLAVRNGLGPLLWWRLEGQVPIEAHPAAFRQLENAAKIAAFNAQLLQECQSQVQAALRQADIPVLWIKGIALAQTVYPRIDLRPMDDLDLLAPFDRRLAALQAAEGLGFHFPPRDALAEKMGLPDQGPADHHYHLRGGPGGQTTLEIHFRLVGDERLLPVEELAWFWLQSQAMGQGAFTILKPEAHLLYLCAHAILQHGEAEFRLQRYYDLHLLASQPQLNWELVAARAIALGWTYAAERALLLTRQYFGTPIPPGVLAELTQRRPQGEDNDRARRLQGAGHRWEGTQMSLAGTPRRERLRQYLHLAAPPAEYMRQRYAIPPGKSLLPYYVFRWLDAGKEMAQASLRAARRAADEPGLRETSAPDLAALPEMTLPNDVLRELMQATLRQGKPFRFQALGGSMRPFIREGDVLVVSPLEGRKPAAGDVAAFIHPQSGSLLVHRLIQWRGASGMMQGDAMPEADGLVLEENILGRVTQVERNGRRVWFVLGASGYLIAQFSRLGLLRAARGALRALRSRKSTNRGYPRTGPE